jgi:predicted anti-sigma-YlaC factor YlaD
MNPEIHERARRLIDARHIEGISVSEREWLEEHLAECAECRTHAGATQNALQRVRSNVVKVSPELVSITQARVRLRASELRENQARMRALWISCTLSWLLGAVTAPLLWEGIAWLGRRFDVSQAIWIVVFGMCWIAPATVVGAFVAWRYSSSSAAANRTWPRRAGF